MNAFSEDYAMTDIIIKAIKNTMFIVVQRLKLLRPLFLIEQENSLTRNVLAFNVPRCTMIRLPLLGDLDP